MRIAGINIPEEKKIKVGLASIYGLGKRNVFLVLKAAQLNAEKRGKDLTGQEVARLQKAIEAVSTEGALRKMVSENIKRLRQIKAYRGARHAANLPVKGQRTRTNARTKRGKRMTVGALKKAAAHRLEAAKKAKE